MKFTQGQALAAKLHTLIPAGGHTYSKGDDQFPQNSPGLMVRGKDAYCWDADGNKFLDYGMGLRSVGLGHANEEINQAVIEQLQLGTNFTRPGIIELAMAEKFIDLIPSVEMVKFAKNGSDVTSAAIRLARAYTGKKYIAICRDHPFYSFNDWFIGSTPCDNGIPEEVSGLTIKFSYNDIESVKKIFDLYNDDIAAVILEPVKNDEPKNNFLQELREITKKKNTVLIFDEMITGFRWHLNGAQTYVGVEPDLTTFGKATANGFSVAILGGKKEIMEMGGIQHDKPRVFLLSGTHGAETIGLAAAIKNIDIYKRDNVAQHHWDYGNKFKNGINKIASNLGISDYFKIGGFACSPTIEAKDINKNPHLGYHTLFSQEMIQKGVLIPWIAFSQSHGDKELELTLNATEHALNIYARALEGDIHDYLIGKAIKPVWRKYN